MSNDINSKELLGRLKDYADCADAAYAYYEFIDTNEKWSVADEFYNYKILNTPNPKWIYADGIKFGDIITSKNETKLSQNNNIELGSVTAYALATEARFNQDKIIEKPKQDGEDEGEKVKIDNNIKNFIFVNKYTKQQELFINNKNPQTNKPYHTISLRTHSFVNRFELVNHIPNTTSGYSSSIFYDNLHKNYCIAFRGTEISGDFGLRDLVIADGLMALTGRALTQIASMKNLKDEMTKSILAHKQRLNSDDKDSYIYQDKDDLKNIDIDTKNTNLSVVLCGHSLGGHMAQMFCLTYPKEAKELYTYNAPGIYGGMWASLKVLTLRLIYLTAKIIYKGAKWLARALDKSSFIGKILNNAFDTIENFFNSNSDERTNLSYPQYANTISNNPNSQYLANNNLSNNISKATAYAIAIEARFNQDMVIM